MKKTALFMACCVGLMFFASCKKDIQPTINVATGSNYASQSTEVFSGDQITVGFSATGEKLTNIEMSVSQNGIIMYSDAQTIDNAESYLYAHSFELEAIGTVTISGTVTDAKGHTATSSFDIIYYEKPNAKFVGHYEGDALFNGTYDIDLSTMNPMHDTLTDQPFPSILDIVAGEENDEVVTTITINEQTNTVKGTVEGNKVVFEAINSVYNMTYQGFTVPINMTYTITGTLNEGMLDLEGTCNGHGDINMLFISGTIDMEGTIGGSLNKTE